LGLLKIAILPTRIGIPRRFYMPLSHAWGRIGGRIAYVNFAKYLSSSNSFSVISMIEHIELRFDLDALDL